MTTLWVLLLLVVLFAVGYVLLSRRDAALRHSSLVPPKGHATMADVERLVEANDLIDAIRCYREIYKCDLTEAKHAIDEMRARLHKHPTNL